MTNSDFHQAEADYWRAEARRLQEAIDTIEVAVQGARSYTTPPEPPIGTRFMQHTTVLWSRTSNGWHCSGHACKNCPVDWAEVDSYLPTKLVRRELGT